MVKCNTMQEVREEIDRIDRDLVKLLAERQGYIEQAGVIKGERSAVRDEARIEDVVQKVLAQADKAGLARMGCAEGACVGTSAARRLAGVRSRGRAPITRPSRRVEPPKKARTLLAASPARNAPHAAR